MNQTCRQSLSFVALVFMLSENTMAFTPPRPRYNTASSSHANTRGRNDQRGIVVLGSSSQLSLETILENPDSFPNTSRILGALSQDNTAGDYKEFLTALSEEWPQYSNVVSKIIPENESWMGRNISPSSPKIATAVGTATSYATVQALDHMHRYESWNGYSTALHEQQSFSSDDSPSYYHPAAVVPVEGYEPSHLAQDYHYENSSPNLLRDLAKSLPPPDDPLGMTDSIYYDEFAPYHDESLYYVADSGLDVAVANVPDGNQVAAPSIPAMSTSTGDVLPANIQSAASDATSTLSSQLSDIAYYQSFDRTETASKRFSMPQFPKAQTIGSHNADEAVSRIKSFATHSTEAINKALAEAKTSGSSQLNDLFGSASHSFDGLPEKVVSIKSSSAESINRAVSEFEKVKVPSFDTSKVPSLDVSKLPNVDMSKMKMPMAPSIPKMDVHVKLPQVPSISGVKSGMTTAESLAVEGQKAATSAHVSFTDNSLADIGNSILGGIQSLGGILFKFIDWIIVAVAGTSLSQILSSIQTSISTLIDNASSSIVNLFNGLGNLTIREIFQAFLTLILVVTDMIFKVTNALVYVISGKDAGDWALQANSAVHTYGDQLLAQAGATYQDVTHKSLGELANSIGDYSHHVGEELLAVLNSFSTQSGVETVMTGDVSYLSAENLDTIATAVQTALTL